MDTRLSSRPDELQDRHRDLPLREGEIADTRARAAARTLLC